MIIYLCSSQNEIDSYMKNRTLIILLFTTLFCTIACKESLDEKPKDSTAQTVNFEQEKAAILQTLNNETKAAFKGTMKAGKTNGCMARTSAKPI